MHSVNLLQLDKIPTFAFLAILTHYVQYCAWRVLVILLKYTQNRCYIDHTAGSSVNTYFFQCQKIRTKVLQWSSMIIFSSFLKTHTIFVISILIWNTLTFCSYNEGWLRCLQILSLMDDPFHMVLQKSIWNYSDHKINQYSSLPSIFEDKL